MTKSSKNTQLSPSLNLMLDSRILTKIILFFMMNTETDYERFKDDPEEFVKRDEDFVESRVIISSWNLRPNIMIN